ncbi:MAG: hypothetical protein LBM93_02940 [Oscillospiraceae bacterium]|jgi:hypothetical protein|nr:hypothetical protein [Oscillospiraceae bacterium]
MDIKNYIISKYSKLYAEYLNARIDDYENFIRSRLIELIINKYNIQSSIAIDTVISAISSITNEEPDTFNDVNDDEQPTMETPSESE